MFQRILILRIRIDLNQSQFQYRSVFIRFFCTSVFTIDTVCFLILGIFNGKFEMMIFARDEC